MNRFPRFYGSSFRRTLIVLSLCLSGCAANPPALPTPVSGPAVNAGTPTPVPALRLTAAPTAVPSPTPRPASATPAATETARACQEAGQVAAFEIDSPPLGRKLPGRIYLPPCYDPSLPGGYPVLYLLHGQSYDESMWLDLGVASIADRLIQSGQIAPLLIVLPREAYYLQDPAESQFRNALIESLIPWVDASYNTCSQRACRAIGGISRGAYWALKLGLSDWQVFISAGAHSLPGGPYSYTKLKTILNAMPTDQRTRIAIDIGAGDGYHKTAERYVQLLQQAGYPVEWRDPEGIHNPDYWSAHIEEYLRWYDQGWGEK